MFAFSQRGTKEVNNKVIIEKKPDIQTFELLFSALFCPMLGLNVLGVAHFIREKVRPHSHFSFTMHSYLPKKLTAQVTLCCPFVESDLKCYLANLEGIAPSLNTIESQPTPFLTNVRAAQWTSFPKFRTPRLRAFSVNVENLQDKVIN